MEKASHQFAYLARTLFKRQELIAAGIQDEKERIGLGKDLLGDVLQRIDQFPQGTLGTHLPRNLKQGFQLMLGPLQFPGAEGQVRLGLALVSDIGLQANDQVYLGLAVEERIGGHLQDALPALGIRILPFPH